MFKYLVSGLLLFALAFTGLFFQNCSDNEFSSKQRDSQPGVTNPVIDPPVSPPSIESFNLGDYPKGDICVESGEQHNLKVDIIDGGYEHKVFWKRQGSEEILHTGEAYSVDVSPDTVGLYEVIIDDSYKREVKPFTLKYCDVEPPVKPPVEPPPVVKPPVEPPVEPPIVDCTPPKIIMSQSNAHIATFVGEERWIGYDVTGDPKPTIKWFFYKVPGEKPTQVYPDQFDNLYDIKPVEHKDAGYYYIVADNGCGDPVESVHYKIDVKNKPTGSGTDDTNQSGEVTGWIETLEVNSAGYIYAKGFTCSKNYNQSIMVKFVAVNAQGNKEIIDGFKTHHESKVHSLCLNTGADKHGFKWTSPQPAIAYKGKTIMVLGVHPSGLDSLNRVIAPKSLQID